MKVIEYFVEREMFFCILYFKVEGVSFEYNLKVWLNIIFFGVIFRIEIKKDMDMLFIWFDDYCVMNVGFGLSYILVVIVVLFVGVLNKLVVLIENLEVYLYLKG